MNDMNMKPWENNDKEETNVLEKNLSQIHFALHKSHTGWSNITSGPLKWKAKKQPPEPSTVKQKSNTLIGYYRPVTLTGQVIINSLQVNRNDIS